MFGGDCIPVSAETVKALPPCFLISCSISGEALRETSATWYLSAANFSATLLPVPVHSKLRKHLLSLRAHQSDVSQDTKHTYQSTVIDVVLVWLQKARQ